MRTNIWLSERLEKIKNTYFSDVPIKNKIIVKFGQKTYRQLGCISFVKMSGFTEKVSLITITGFLRSEEFPEEIVDITLAHEFVHYSHGFSSPLPRMFKYPHQGGVVNKELRQRGLTQILKFQQTWLKNNWRAKTH